MSKQGKITVKHFLNERLKPEIETGIEKYPIFCMVLYNRHTIIKKSITSIRLSKEEFETKKYTGKYKRQVELSLKYELKILYSIIELFASDKEKNSISNNFLNFDSQFSYKSKNPELNQLNSYLNYYISNINEAITNFVYNENVILEFKNKLEKVFNFEKTPEIKESIIDVFGNAEIFASDWDAEEKIFFLKNNISKESVELVFLSYCFEQFENFVENKVTGYWCVPLFEWLFNYPEISKNYSAFVLKDINSKDFSKKIGVDLNEKTVEKQLYQIKKIVFDKDFYLKNKR